MRPDGRLETGDRPPRSSVIRCSIKHLTYPGKGSKLHAPNPIGQPRQESSYDQQTQKSFEGRRGISCFLICASLCPGGPPRPSASRPPSPPHHPQPADHGSSTPYTPPT